MSANGESSLSSRPRPNTIPNRRDEELRVEMSKVSSHQHGRRAIPEDRDSQAPRALLSPLAYPSSVA
jgi:hypothetical protein